MVDFSSLFDDDDLREIGADTPSPKATHPAPVPTNPSASKIRYNPEANNPRAFESNFPRASRYESHLHPIDNRAKSGLPPEFKEAREQITGVYSTKIDESGNLRKMDYGDKTKFHGRPSPQAQPQKPKLPEHPTAQQNTNEINPVELARRVEEAEREARLREFDEIEKRLTAQMAKKEAEKKSIDSFDRTPSSPVLSAEDISQFELKTKLASDLGIPVETPDGVPLNAPDVFEELEILDEGSENSKIPLFPDLPENPFGSEMSSQVQIIMEKLQTFEDDDSILIPTGTQSNKIPETSKAFSDRPTSGTQNSIDAFFASMPRTNPPKKQPLPTETQKPAPTPATTKAEDPDQTKLGTRNSGIMRIPARKKS